MSKLHLGCGNRKIPEYINIDIREDVKPDMVWDTSTPLPWNNEIEVIYSCHNLEHYKRNELPQVLKNWFNALKPGGILRLSVPNFEAIVSHYSIYKDLKVLYGLLHGGLKNDFDIHYVSFDFDTLKNLLLSVGFKTIEKYDRWSTEHGHIDDYSAATLNPPFDKSGMLMSLNVEAVK